MSCLLFSGAFHLQTDDVLGDAGGCFSEVGGNLYDYDHPIVPKWFCAEITVNIKIGRNRASFQKPSRHVIKCCSVDIAVVTTNRLCLKWSGCHQHFLLSARMGKSGKWLTSHHLARTVQQKFTI